MAQGLTAARELRVLGNTSRHEMTVHPLQPQVKAQNLVYVNKVMCGVAGAALMLPGITRAARHVQP